MGHRVAVMRDGVLQQCDTPQRLYDRPANRFVASFIGSPPMNLVAAHVTTFAGDDRADRTAVTVGSMRRDVRIVDPESIRMHTDVILGVRPEQFDPRPGPPGAGGLDGVVRVVEPLGSDQFVTIDIGEGTRITARLRPEAVVRIGDRIGLTTLLHGAHLFEPSDGTRLAGCARTLEES